MVREETMVFVSPGILSTDTLIPEGELEISIYHKAYFIGKKKKKKKKDVPRQKNGYRKCGSFTQWNTQLLRMRTS
jgi:hypothetical protein